MHAVRLSAALAAASALALVLSGCMPFLAGPMASEEREIDAASVVVLATSGDLTIREGEPRLVIHAPENALDRLTSEVEGDSLVLGTTPGPGFGIGRVRYELSLPDLEGIELAGSGDIDADVSSDGTLRVVLDGSGDIDWTGLDADRVDVRLSGSGDIELEGSATGLTVELEGSGNVSADDLDAREAVVSIDGSGNVDVAARDTLSASIAGSGRISYSGDPQVDEDVSGSGDVVRD
jgi:hypothetical protein